MSIWLLAVSLLVMATPFLASGLTPLTGDLDPRGAAPGRDPARVTGLSWMTGHWVSTREGVTTEEHWTSPEGGALLGMNKVVRAGRMVSFEFLRIEASAAGGVAYVASPQGGAATSFALVEQGERRVVFANEAHDFPQRILYRVDEAGALHARIEGTTGGRAQHQEWVFTVAR